MIYLVADTLTVRTVDGIMELQSGEMVTMAEDMARPLLEQGRIKMVEPYLDVDGSLVIPFWCDSRYHWWKGGQSVADTEQEVSGWKH